MNFAASAFLGMPRGFLFALLVLFVATNFGGRPEALGLPAGLAAAGGSTQVQLSDTSCVGFGVTDNHAGGCRGTPAGNPFDLRGGFPISSARGDQRCAPGLTGLLRRARSHLRRHV